MTLIGIRVVYSVFVAGLLFPSGLANFHAPALNEPALQLGGISRSACASTQQPLAATPDKSKADAADRAFEQGLQLHREGSVESLKEAVDKYSEALLLYRGAADRRNEAKTLHRIGMVYSGLGEKQKALDYYNQALPLWRAVGDSNGEAATLNNLGDVYSALGEKQKALDYFNQALPLTRAVGSRAGEATTLNNLALVYNDLGEKQKALDYFNQALPLLRAVGDRAREATTLSNIARSTAN